tara:strand:- start:692 stop:946 length:255 start_codon:yes stop_codon:yes gene_type:complete
MHLNLQALRETEKSYDDTQEIVAYLLDGNPIGRVFLMTALQHYAKEVIEYVDNLPEDAPITIIDPHALAREAEKVKELMDKHYS